VVIGKVHFFNAKSSIILLVFFRDHLVRSDLCSLKGLTDSNRSIDVLTSAVPHVWTSTDHRCIVWCRQLVLTTTRALLEISKENNADPQRTMEVV
jgi:hypothetical protein